MLNKIFAYLLKHPLLTFVGLGFVVYGLSLFNGFVWDDEEQVVNNLAIRSLVNLPFFFTQSTFNTGGGSNMGGMYYKPLMTAFFSLISLFSGQNAWGFHLVQFVLHSLNSFMIFKLFGKFMKKEWAMLGGLLFLVHPGNVESVVYVSALQEILFMFFGLLALLVATHEKLKPQDWLTLGVLLFLSALGKETGILFWVGVLGYFGLYKKEYLLPYLRLFALLVGVYIVLRYGVAGVGLGYNKLSPIMLASFEERLLSMPRIVLYYLRLLVFPIDLAISQHWVVKVASWQDFYWPLIVTLAAVVSWLVALFSQLSKREVWRNLVFFTLFFGLGMGLHSQIVALDLTVSERWLYLPLFAFLGFIMVLGQQLKKPIWLFYILSLVVVIFSVRTVVRTLDWKDGLTLFVHDEPLARGNFDFENNLGVYYYRAGKPKMAAIHYQRSTEIAPHWWTNWNNLGVVYQQAGKLLAAEEAYLRSINNGDYYLAYENYASLLLKQRRYTELRKFLVKQALPRFPYNIRIREISSYLEQQNVD